MNIFHIEGINTTPARFLEKMQAFRWVISMKLKENKESGTYGFGCYKAHVSIFCC